MSKELIPKVKIILTQASEISKTFDDNYIRPEHIILGILKDGDNTCTLLLKELNVDLDRLTDDITQQLNYSTLNPIVGHTKRLKLPFSKESDSVFKILERQSDDVGSKEINTSHILLSILTQTKWEIVKTLRNHKVTHKSVKDLIMKIGGISNAFSDEEDDQPILGRSRNPRSKPTNSNSKTPVLDNFCRDISKYAAEGGLDPVVGRTTEIKRVSQILSRRKKNNPVLIGEPGVGKTAIVEGLAVLIHEGKASRILLDKKIYSLDLASIVAGTKYRGQFEERMKAILEELKDNKNIILFIDELHTIVGAGNSSGAMDAANIFKPALARGEIQVIGATTLNEFRENIEKDGALTRRFQQIIVNEPSLDETIEILKNIKSTYEDHHRVIYTDEAIIECVKMSDRYISDRAMPDKAIDVLDEAGATTNINQKTPDNIKVLEENKESLHLEKLNVVKQQNYEKAAKLRDEERKISDELEKKKAQWLSSLDKKRTTVDVNLIAEVVSMMTGIPVNKISSQETKKLMSMDKDLMGKVIGQDAAVTKVVKAIKRNRLGIKDKSKPIGSFIFLGPTGVGKTLLAKYLAENLFGDSDALVRVDMSEYMEKHSVSRLIGSPPGYVGYEEGGQLTEKVRRRPYAVILFDEIEKAHDDVFNVLLQLLDEGQLTDGLGRKINFKNCLIIMTSNVGVTELSSFGKNMGFDTNTTLANQEEKMRSIIEKALKTKFKPEFLNRLDDTIIFNSLTRDDIKLIIDIELEKLKERVRETGIELKINKSTVDYVAEQGYDEAYGARPLNRAIQRYIEEPVADKILEGTFKEGDTINITYDKKQEKIVLK